ncbi:MAG: hypothetical protein M3Y67_00475, partial [Pseudomonadota bacterium]|nr:hypothetical protein [Pseudomonadota bacterium]
MLFFEAALEVHRRFMNARIATHFVVLSASGLAGAVAVLAWAPFGFWPLVIGCYGLLFWLLQRRSHSLRSALSVGAAFGLGLHGVGHGWMYGTLHGQVGLGPIAAGLSTLLYLCYLAAFTALPCALIGIIASRLPDRAAPLFRWPELLCFAAALTLGEWLRSFLFNGFTSLSVGYVTVDNWLGGYAPVGGLYLASFVIYLLAGLSALVLMPAGRGGW